MWETFRQSKELFSRLRTDDKTDEANDKTDETDDETDEADDKTDDKQSEATDMPDLESEESPEQRRKEKGQGL